MTLVRLAIRFLRMGALLSITRFDKGWEEDYNTKEEKGTFGLRMNRLLQNKENMWAWMY